MGVADGLHSMSKFDIYKTVTNLIVQRLELGVVP